MIDYHIHTTFSDGEKTVEEVMCLAKQRGITSLAITDHFDPFDITLRNSPKTCDELKAHFISIKEAAQRYELTAYCGIETCTDACGRLRLPAGVKELCELIITSPHYISTKAQPIKGEYFNDEYWHDYKALVLALAAGEGDVLGHPEGYLPIKPMLSDTTTYESRKELCRELANRYFDAEYIAQLADALHKSGKACELHGATDTPREWVVKAMHDKGVRFSVGSDAHAMNLLGANERAMSLVQQYSLEIIKPKTIAYV